MFKVNIRTRHQFCSKLTLERDTSSGVFIVNFKHISDLVLVLLLLTLNMQLSDGIPLTLVQNTLSSLNN